MKKLYTARSKIIFRQYFTVLVLIAAVTAPFAQTSAPHYPIRRLESNETWLRDGRAAIERAKALKPN